MAKQLRNMAVLAIFIGVSTICIAQISPWPWSVKDLPMTVKDLIGRKCRIAHTGEAMAHEKSPGLITIYLDKEDKITDIVIEPSQARTH